MSAIAKLEGKVDMLVTMLTARQKAAEADVISLPAWPRRHVLCAS
jgi:hypothetical protein